MRHHAESTLEAFVAVQPSPFWSGCSAEFGSTGGGPVCAGAAVYAATLVSAQPRASTTSRADIASLDWPEGLFASTLGNCCGQNRERLGSLSLRRHANNYVKVTMPQASTVACVVMLWKHATDLGFLFNTPAGCAAFAGDAVNPSRRFAHC